jgi:hypothetical protein
MSDTQGREKPDDTSTKVRHTLVECYLGLDWVFYIF